MPTADERRSQPRAPLHGNVVAFVGDERVDCTALDISAAGLAMLSPVARRPGQFIRVNFCLLAGGATPRWYDADGVVVRASQARTGVVLGVQFVVIEDRVAREVHGYVAETLRSIASRAVDLRRVAGSSVLAGSSAASSSTTEGRIPDANHPPKATGEFGPPEPRRGGTAPAMPRVSTSETTAQTRRTGEYGSSPATTPGAAQPTTQGEAPGAATPGAPVRTRPATIPPSTVDTAVGRRPTPVPKPAPAPDASRERVAEEVSKSEIAALIKQALDEVDRGPPTGPGKGRSKPRR
ncbi:MAG: PilZ domain-containing protein [Nannocystaceae bacterium]|nr:PilZ domain-containing protein [Nannocystaceae bacterium]